MKGGSQTFDKMLSPFNAVAECIEETFSGVFFFIMYGLALASRGSPCYAVGSTLPEYMGALLPGPVCCDNAMGIHDVTRSLRSPTVRCLDSGRGVGHEATEDVYALGIVTMP